MNQNQLFSYTNLGLPADILAYKLSGHFDRAIRLIDQTLSNPSITKELRCCLMTEREIILRLPSDFPFSRQEALDRIREHIFDFSEEEFDSCLDSGQIRWIYVNGQMRIFDRFFESMCKSMPDFAKRAGTNLPGGESSKKGSTGDLRLNHAMHIIKEKGFMSNRIRIRASVRVKDSVFTPGMSLLVHLPIPAACEQQSDIKIEHVFPKNVKIAPETAPQRTVCWEETMQENHDFTVEYSYIHTARWHDTERMQKEMPGSCESQDLSEYSEYLKECSPHILFTPYLRALTEELSNGCKSPLEKAKRFYDYITLHFKYTYMPAYFSLESIADTAAKSLTGDCGVFALLFLTMCRIAKIPACWQSGLAAEPDFIGGHDWVRFYAAPFGWLYADVSYGIGAVRVENEERRNFYFGNLDPYRMVANNAFQAPFTVEKKYWRTDPFDNQLGEIETDKRGLRYEEYVRTKDILLCQEL